MSGYLYFLGIDWGNDHHAVCFIDATKTKRVNRVFSHSAEGHTALIQWLRGLVKDFSQVAAAIERPDHPVIDALLDVEVSCFSINPKQAERLRECFFPSEAKDDRRDARALAEAIRTNIELFAKIEPPDAMAVAIRGAYRRSCAESKDFRALANRLWEDVARIVPEFLSTCRGADTPFFWDLLELAADPAAAAKMSPAKVTKLLQKHGKRTLKTAELHALIHAPRFERAAGVLDSVLRDIQALLPQLRLLHTLHEATLAELEKLVSKAGRDAEIIDSFPGAAYLTVAAFLSEAPEAIKQRDLQALRHLSGSAPVTKASGKHRGVVMRRACNGRLRDACYHMARTASYRDPYAEKLYESLHVGERSAARAYRGVSDRLLKRLVACLKSDALYDPAGPKTKAKVTAAGQPAGLEHAEPAAAACAEVTGGGRGVEGGERAGTSVA